MLAGFLTGFASSRACRIRGTFSGSASLHSVSLHRTANTSEDPVESCIYYHIPTQVLTAALRRRAPGLQCVQARVVREVPRGLAQRADMRGVRAHGGRAGRGQGLCRVRKEQQGASSLWVMGAGQSLVATVTCL